MRKIISQQKRMGLYIRKPLKENKKVENYLKIEINEKEEKAKNILIV